MTTPEPVPFNLNDHVTWTPTREGAATWNAYAVEDVRPEHMAHVKIATPGEPMKVQAWELMRALGPSMSLGGSVLVEGMTVLVHPRGV